MAFSASANPTTVTTQMRSWSWGSGRNEVGSEAKRGCALTSGTYLANIAAEIVDAYGPKRNPDLSLYSIYLRDDGYVKIKVIALQP